MTTLLEAPPVSFDADGFPMFSEDLVERLVSRRRLVASVEAECTALVAEMIHRDVHDDLAYRSIVSLLMDRLGVSAGVARGMIRVATALAEMPHAHAALAAGDIDLSRVRLLVSAREANPELLPTTSRPWWTRLGGWRCPTLAGRSTIGVIRPLRQGRRGLSGNHRARNLGYVA